MRLSTLTGRKKSLREFDPTRAIGGEATGRHHAMYMGMEFEFLTPGMQHAEETDFCAEMFWIACNFDKCFRTGAKQEIVYGLLVLQRQWGQLTGKREDHMHVRCRKKFPATLFQPAFASARLTLRAMPISARVVRDGTMSAASALIKMAAEHGSTTTHDSQEHFDMLPADPLTASFDECSLPQREPNRPPQVVADSIYSSCGDSLFSDKESRGLAVAFR